MQYQSKDYVVNLSGRQRAVADFKPLVRETIPDSTEFGGGMAKY
jgi:hypothetical protein